MKKEWKHLGEIEESLEHPRCPTCNKYLTNARNTNYKIITTVCNSCGTKVKYWSTVFYSIQGFLPQK